MAGDYKDSRWIEKSSCKVISGKTVLPAADRSCTASADSEKYDYRKIAGVLVTLGCIWWLWKQSGHDFLLLYGVLILGAQGISFQKIMKVYFLVIGSLFVLTIGCASVGIIENYVYYRADGSVRHALGLSAPTNFGAVAFYLTMVWWYLRKEKITWPEIGVIAALLRLCRWW